MEIHEEFTSNGFSSVLFGGNTNLDKAADCRTVEELKPLHFTVEYKDPMTSLTVARTYFLTRGNNRSKELQELLVPQEDTLIIDLVY